MRGPDLHGAAFLADPDFVNKAAEGRADEINTCIACNQACLDHAFENKRASCLVNPFACHETELTLEPTADRKRVAVVGGGMAGLSAACSAAERGHDVVLFEARDAIGGQFDMARVIPGKEEFDETLRYFTRRVETSGVELRLSTRVDVAALQAESFDAVILATGVRPRALDLPGMDRDDVLTYPQVLRDQVEVGRRVAIIGAGGIGFDVAEFLTERRAKREHPDLATFMGEWGVDLEQWGKDEDAARGELRPRTQANPARQVTLLQRKTTKHGANLGKTTGWIRRASLKHRGVEFLGGVSYERVDDAGLHIKVGDEARVLEVDHVVVCAGQVKEDGLAAPLPSRLRCPRHRGRGPGFGARRQAGDPRWRGGRGPALTAAAARVGTREPFSGRSSGPGGSGRLRTRPG